MSLSRSPDEITITQLEWNTWSVTILNTKLNKRYCITSIRRWFQDDPVLNHDLVFLEI